MRHLHKTVVMVGMMGAGKTAVRDSSARLLAVPFRDSDEEIVKAADRSIQIFGKRDGEAFFRARESEVLSRLCAASPASCPPVEGVFVANRPAVDLGVRGVGLVARRP